MEIMEEINSDSSIDDSSSDDEQKSTEDSDELCKKVESSNLGSMITADPVDDEQNTFRKKSSAMLNSVVASSRRLQFKRSNFNIDNFIVEWTSVPSSKSISLKSLNICIYA